MSIAMHKWPRRHRISVEHYYRMSEAGLFAPDERVELIDGEVVDMPPMGTRHAAQLSHLVDLLSAAIGERGMVRVQLPLRLDDASEPQPDIAIVLPRSDYYEHRHPGGADTLLAIEISDTPLEFDRDVKARSMFSAACRSAGFSTSVQVVCCAFVSRPAARSL
jgi:Uma2 family endonuclease